MRSSGPPGSARTSIRRNRPPSGPAAGVPLRPGRPLPVGRRPGPDGHPHLRPLRDGGGGGGGAAAAHPGGPGAPHYAAAADAALRVRRGVGGLRGEGGDGRPPRGPPRGQAGLLRVGQGGNQNRHATASNRTPGMGFMNPRINAVELCLSKCNISTPWFLIYLRKGCCVIVSGGQGENGAMLIPLLTDPPPRGSRSFSTLNNHHHRTSERFGELLRIFGGHCFCGISQLDPNHADQIMLPGSSFPST